MKIKEFLKRNLKYLFPMLLIVLVFTYSLANLNITTPENDTIVTNSTTSNLEKSKNTSDAKKIAQKNKVKNSNNNNKMEDKKNSKKKITNSKNVKISSSTKTKKKSKTSSNRNKNSSDNNKTKSQQSKKEEISCYISIDCSDVLDNMDKLRKNKKDIIPSNGIMLSSKKITIDKNSSVYDLLLKAARQYSILIDSQYTAVYNSAYIRGINNLYEMDCGSSSGWVYEVNGVSPHVGCSQYTLNSGDNVKFIFVTTRGGF